jgi:hypothetical protein
MNFMRPLERKPFSLHAKQIIARNILKDPRFTHILLRGGARSGKSFLLLRAMIIRALKTPSKHVIFRQRFNHLKSSIVAATMPSVLKLCFPGLVLPLNKTDYFYQFPNGSVIQLAGLDDKERTEKVLGSEYSTTWLNECSQISYASRNIAITRLAENSGLRLKAYYDCNPPDNGHWCYSLWFKHKDPVDKIDLPNADKYAEYKINPNDNVDNLPPEFFESMASMPKRERIRFLDGEFAAQVANALWNYEILEKSRKDPAKIFTLGRKGLAIDPSGCAGPDDWRSDEIGMVMGATDPNGRESYIMGDYTDRYSPQQWAQLAVDLYWQHDLDFIVAEKNFGGALVEQNIKSIDARVNVKLVTASKGKHVRAEPISTLFENDRAFLAGTFPELEEQLVLFSTNGYAGSRSPDRADAMVWLLHELMLGAEKPYTLMNVLG